MAYQLQPSLLIGIRHLNVIQHVSVLLPLGDNPSAIEGVIIEMKSNQWEDILVFYD